MKKFFDLQPQKIDKNSISENQKTSVLLQGKKITKKITNEIKKFSDTKPIKSTESKKLTKPIESIEPTKHKKMIRPIGPHKKETNKNKKTYDTKNKQEKLIIKKNKKTPNQKFIGIFLMFIIISIAIFFSIKENKGKEIYINKTPLPNEIKMLLDANSGVINNLGMYINEKYGFSFNLLKNIKERVFTNEKRETILFADNVSGLEFQISISK